MTEHASDRAGTLVETPAGAVRGAVVGATRQFLGIPYAVPPTGASRWRAPEPALPWTGVLDATTPPTPCLQVLPVVDMVLGQEDCLYLNVTAPAEPPGTPAPVMVWIHGGGFTVGSANDDVPTRLVARSGVVVVSVNYRLGPFGYLAHPALQSEDDAGATGTMGFLDQVCALEWVRDSIAAFGGDPANVTIFGESAGGMSVFMHLVSPRSAGLFHRAILQSGPCVSGSDIDAALRQGHELAVVLGCDRRPDPLAAMREIDASAILAALPPDPTFLFRHAARWMPVGDDVVLPALPSDAVRTGHFNRVPVLAGVTRDEGRLFVGMSAHTYGAEEPPVAAGDYPARLESYFGVAIGREAAHRYPLAEYPDPGAAFGQAIGDAVIACPAIDGAVAMAAHTSVHLYQYEHAPNPFVLPMSGIDLGAFHAAELPYVFGGPVLSSGPFEFTEAEQELSDTVVDAWTRFARTGDPSGPQLDWPRAGPEQTFVVLDTPVRTGRGLNTGVRDFWRETGWVREMSGRH